MPRPRPATPRSNALGLALALAAALSGAGCAGMPRDRHVQPQRPTFSSSTRTTPPDVVEVEAGIALDPGKPNDDLDLPVLLKLGLGPRTELFGGISLWRGIDGDEAIGDSLIGVRHRLWDETRELPSSAFQLTTKLPTGRPRYGVGSGETDFFAAGIHTRTLEQLELTGFYQLGLIGVPEAGSSELQVALAGVASTDITRRWLGFAELAAVFQPDSDIEAVFVTLGGAFRYAPWMYLDLGLVVGLTEDAPDVLLLFGLTRSVGRVLGLSGTPHR